MGNKINRTGSKLKRILLVLIILVFSFAVYVVIVNRNSKNMTARQKILKAVYPAWMWLSRMTGKNNAHAITSKQMKPPVSFYSLKMPSNTGSEIDFSQFKGKKVMLVNTASNCGYTNQYDDLEKLYKEHAGKLVILAFPANDFKEQEKGSDEEIAQFCKLNFGISFPLMKKTVVIKMQGQNPVFQWLTDPAKNGWNSMQPEWNFSKYLVNEEGVLTNYFGPMVSPLSKEVITAIQ